MCIKKSIPDEQIAEEANTRQILERIQEDERGLMMIEQKLAERKKGGIAPTTEE